MPRKSLIYRVWKGSLHRHHYVLCLTNQCLIYGTLRHIPLNYTGFHWVKAP